MSSRDHQDEFLIFVLGLAAVIGVIAGAVYVFSYFMPDVLFYVLPFSLASIAIGFALWFLVQNGEARFEQVSEWNQEQKYVSGFNFKTLAIVYPGLIFMTFMAFEAGGGQRVLVDKKGQVQGVYLEWPKLNQKYNQVRAKWFATSMFESLREDAKRTVVYDRSDLGAVIWMALILGGPALFLWLSRNVEREEQLSLSKAADEKVRERKEQLRVLIEEQQAIMKRKQKPLEDQIQELRNRVGQVVSENQVLKAKMEFGKPAQTVKAIEKSKSGGSGGVLDGDLL